MQAALQVEAREAVASQEARDRAMLSADKERAIKFHAKMRAAIRAEARETLADQEERDRATLSVYDMLRDNISSIFKVEAICLKAKIITIM
jgi:hypothetical protein